MTVLQIDQYPQVEFIILADAVECVNGKLYMIGGGWTVIRSPSYPATLHIGIAINLLTAPGTPLEEFELKIVILSEKDEVVSPSLKAKVIKRATPEISDKPESTIFAANLGIQILHPGAYRIRATFGSASKELAFNAVITTQ